VKGIHGSVSDTAERRGGLVENPAASASFYKRVRRKYYRRQIFLSVVLFRGGCLRLKRTASDKKIKKSVRYFLSRERAPNRATRIFRVIKVEPRDSYPVLKISRVSLNSGNRFFD
jgi:hypothetical protein